MKQSAATALEGPELFIGLVGAVGTDLDLVTSELAEALEEVRYTSRTLRLIKLIQELNRWKSLPTEPLEKRYDALMTAGNEFRDIIKRGDAMALLGVLSLREDLRKSAGASAQTDSPPPRTAYIFRSLKHPDEEKTLRNIYGPGFLLVAAYAPRHSRVNSLATRIAASHHMMDSTPYFGSAEQLVYRDEQEIGIKFGQNVRETYPRADVFLNASNTEELKRSVKRFVELLFGNSFLTPSRDEFGMFHAQAAALRSASLGRQVGAAIATTEGDIISVGTNEVPKAGGGLYWSDDAKDFRDHVAGEDSNDNMKRNILAEILSRLGEAGWITEEKKNKDVNELVIEALFGKASPFGQSSAPPLLHGTQFLNLIEFGRAVHAEMAALLDAARRGVAVKGGTLYTTTFPCHDCARHIVAAGIQRVVYIEPYPKSLAASLYPDSLAVDCPTRTDGQVCFEPFVGIAPRQYMNLFMMVERKKQGQVIKWVKDDALPRLSGSPPSYLRNELLAIKILDEKMVEQGLLTQQGDLNYG